MNVTDGDRERASQVADQLSEVLDDMSGLYPAGVDLIATALAEEREKARAPFLRLAELIERPLLSERESGCVSERTQVFQDAAALIRITAEVTE